MHPQVGDVKYLFKKQNKNLLDNVNVKAGYKVV